MTRKGYYHGDKFITYKRGNLAGKYGPSSKNNYAKKTVYNSGNYNKSKNNHKSDYKPKTSNKSTYKQKHYPPQSYNKPYTKFNDPSFKPNWSCAPNYDKNYYERNKTGGNKSFNSTSNSNDDWIVGLCCLGIVIIFIIFAIL